MLIYIFDVGSIQLSNSFYTSRIFFQGDIQEINDYVDD